MNFNLEGASHGGNCSYDYMAVYDNSTIPGTGGLVGRYCGNVNPPDMTSTENMISLRFVR
jgi:cubilin